MSSRVTASLVCMAGPRAPHRRRSGRANSGGSVGDNVRLEAPPSVIPSPCRRGQADQELGKIMADFFFSFVQDDLKLKALDCRWVGCGARLSSSLMVPAGKVPIQSAPL